MAGPPALTGRDEILEQAATGGSRSRQSGGFPAGQNDPSMCRRSLKWPWRHPRDELSGGSGAVHFHEGSFSSKTPRCGE
jgi:hypothetical protein